MNLSFENKVALVTGAASGMGLATAKAFAQAGAAVVLADFKEEAVKAEAEKLTAAGHKAIAVRCDVSDDAQVVAMVDLTVAEFGRLDAAFNNAGVMAHIAPTGDSSREDWDRVIRVNLRGVWSCMKHELRQMERQGSGAIVNNASVGALTGNPGIGSYIASKHGVVGLTRTAALEYVKHGIRVNAVNPGLIDTQVARDVVNGYEQAYDEIARHVPIGAQAGRRRLPPPCYGFAVRGQATSSVMRWKLAREFGATDVVDEGVARIKELTKGFGADSVLECVGTEDSMMQAIKSTRPGGFIGFVGVPSNLSKSSTLTFICTVDQLRCAATCLNSLSWF
jgi:NAD(P)-dependent dehydrogenase (short-subunit alcohol dehydrogenase family)